MSFKSLPLIGLALALSACGGTINRGVESVHQPIVQRTDYVIDLAADGGGLAAGEPQRLDGWFRSIAIGYGDRVGIDDPYGNPDVRSDVARILGRRGLLVSADAPVTAGQVQPGTVRVVVSRSTASVPGCPDWSLRASPDFVSSTMSNFGCANNAALAAIVADPMDLVQGRNPDRPNDPTTVAKAIKTYRELPSTGTRDLKTQSTSKVGQ